MQPEVYKPGLANNKQLVKLLREFQQNPASLNFVTLAEEYRKQGLINQALEICEEGLAHHPELSSALLVKARCFFDQRKFADALAIAEKISSQNPENIRAHKLCADIFTRLGQRRAAMASFQHVLRLYPQDEQALSAYEQLKALEQKPTQELRAALPSEMGDSSGRIDDFQVGSFKQSMEVAAAMPAPVSMEEIEPEEEPAIATRTIAELYLRQGLQAKARAVLRKMLQDGPTNSWARETLQELQSNGILLPIQQAKAPGKKEILERKLRYLERLLSRVQLAARA